MLSTVTMFFVLNDYTLLAPLKPPEISEGCVSEEYIVVFKTTASEDQGEDGCTQNLLWLVFFCLKLTVTVLISISINFIISS